MILSFYDKKILNYLLLIAETVPKVGSSKLAACIVYKKEIISIGINSSKTTTLMQYFNRHPSAIMIHAEIAAIHNALKKMSYSNLKKSTIYIARSKLVDGTSVPGLAMPCVGCAKALEHFQLKRVVFTSDNVNYN